MAGVWSTGLGARKYLKREMKRRYPRLSRGIIYKAYLLTNLMTRYLIEHENYLARVTLVLDLSTAKISGNAAIFSA